MPEPTYGAGRTRKEGKRKGYGKQSLKDAPGADAGAGDRRKQAMQAMMEGTRARTAQSLATTAQTQTAQAGASAAAIGAGNLLSSVASPGALGALAAAARKSGQGVGAPITGHGAAARLARRFENKNTIQGVTKLISKWGGVVQQQGHHDETEYERDVSFAAGQSPAEMAKLQILKRALMKAYGPGAGQMGAYGPGDHMDHLHMSFNSPTDLRLQELILGHKSYFEEVPGGVNSG